MVLSVCEGLCFSFFRGQKRIQQYNQMISSRNMPQSTMSVPGSLSGSDLGGVRMLPGGNGMGMLGWD